MNEREFESQLKADGFQEIELQELVPRPGKGRHGHHFAIRGLVLTGAFLVTQDSDPSLTALGKSLPWQRANCTTSRSDRKARACL
jgi:hypothetical protein